MMVAHSGRVLAFLLLCTASFAAELQPSVLAKYLPKEKASVLTYPHYYDRADTATSCIRYSTIRNCDLALLGALHYESDMQCCNTQADDRFLSPLRYDIGKCSWELRPYILAILRSLQGNGDQVEQLGSYTVQCELNQGSEECGEGLCDDMILTGEGALYYIPDAAFTSMPDLTGIDACTIATGLAQQGLTVRKTSETTPAPDLTALLPKHPPTRNPSKAAIQSADYYRSGNTTYYGGAAVVAAGPVEVSSRNKEMKFDDGYMQATIVYLTNGDVITPDATTFIADPYAMELKLRHKESGYRAK